jgi:hypothetical protein
MDPEQEDYADRYLPPPRALPDWVVETALGAVMFLGLILVLAAVR